MKILFLTLFLGFGLTVSAQQKNITVEAANYGYSVGVQPSIILTIHDAKKEDIEKLVAKEVKSWGGKTTSKEGELATLQASNKKFIDGKAYDAYTKIYQDMKDVKISTTVNLGGAYMTESEHPVQFGAFKTRMYNFGISIEKTLLANQAKAEKGNLKSLEKELKSFEKTKSSRLKQIESYQSKIKEIQKEVSEIDQNIATKKKEIIQQENQIKIIQNTTVK